MNRIYACIDLKSFYASVECNERGLDPLKTNLIVADPNRTEKTICLAVSPSLKKYGIKGRARLFEVVQKIKEVNYERKKNTINNRLIGKSYNDDILTKNNNIAIDYIIAPPRMSYYMKYSTDIYNVYLKYISPEDLYVYSIDEVFLDITTYLKYNKMGPREFITKIIHDVYKTTGITATAGIGTNLYLAKVAMDIVAKHTEADCYGVRIAYLDELSYRRELWSHKPLTSFWRVGDGYQKKLNVNNIYTMGDIARTSLENEEVLYKLFGVNAEILIDHAWGFEPCTIKDIKRYKPDNSSISSGQVLHSAYNYEKTKLIIKEMAENLSLDLTAKNLTTNQIVITIGYDIDNLNNSKIDYDGPITTDHYGRNVPKHAHGTINIDRYTSSSKKIIESSLVLYDRIINKKLLVRRINITACNLIDKDKANNKIYYHQINLFDDSKKTNEKKEDIDNIEEKELKLQQTLLNIKNKYGKNAILKGMNLKEGATMIERNSQIGGHKE